VHAHKLPGYRAVTLSLKRAGLPPGDVTADQMDGAADLAERFSQGELRVTHDQNLLLPWVRESELRALWLAAREGGFATPNIGLLTDMIACPGGDLCALANARSIPIAAAITERFDDLDELHDIGDIDLHISGCINSCGHHHSGHIGVLGVDKDGMEWYQVSVAGADGSTLSGKAVPGKVIGPSFCGRRGARRDRSRDRHLPARTPQPASASSTPRAAWAPCPFAMPPTPCAAARRWPVMRAPEPAMQFIAPDAALPAQALQLDNTPTCWRSATLIHATRRGAAVPEVDRRPRLFAGRAAARPAALRGQIVAAGEVLADMLPLLRRCGFDAVQLRADQQLESPSVRWASSTPTTRRCRPSAPRCRPHVMSRAIELNARATPGFEDRVAHAVAVLQSAAAEHTGPHRADHQPGRRGHGGDRPHRPPRPAHRAGHAGHRQAARADAGADPADREPATAWPWNAGSRRPSRRDRFVRTHGELAMRESVALRKACCALRKLEPLARLLQGRSAWVTGLRREQSGTRAEVPHRT
jgi:hypothetical protein